MAESEFMTMPMLNKIRDEIRQSRDENSSEFKKWISG